MEDQATKVFLKRQSRYLWKLLKQTVTHPSRFIDYDQLAAFIISLTDFSLHSDLACDAVPRFFKPFPHDIMEKSLKRSSQWDKLWWPPYDPEYDACFNEPLDVEAILDRYHRHVIAELEESSSRQSMWQARCALEPGVKYEEDLWEDRYRQNDDTEEWRVNTVFYTGLASKPHLACPLVEGGIPDDRIRQAELLGILRLMKSAMRPALRPNAIDRHTIYPVAIYSLSSRQGRVLHAHFDGQTLHIRRSNYVDLKEKNMDNIKLYLRWMMSDPIGDTMAKVSTAKDTTPSKA